MHNDNKTIKTADIIIKADLGLVEVNGSTIRLGPVNMKVLIMLVNHSNAVVSRAELFDSIWTNQVISDDVLTKCISEIRTKIGKHSHYRSLILTVPKKGYQWNPSQLDKPQSVKVSALSKQKQVEEQVQTHKQMRIKAYLKNLFIVIFSLITLSTSFLWIGNKLIEKKYMAILLLPIETKDNKLQSDAKSFEDLLRKNILSTEKMRFLSPVAMTSDSRSQLFNQNTYFKTQWAINAQIRQTKDKRKYSLSLIDTRTGLEIYTKSIETNQNHNKLDKFSLDFIQTIDQKLNH